MDLLSDPALSRLVGELGALPAPPRVVADLNAGMADERFTLRAAAAIVETDVAVAAKVLQLVNSGYYALARRLTSIREAVAYLGLETLRAVTVNAALFAVVRPEQLPQGFSLEALDVHARLVSRLALQLAPGPAAASDASAAGLLHDVGKLVLALRRPVEMAAALRLAHAESLSAHEAEQRTVGCSHAAAGGYLLARWGLPAEIAEAAAGHHDPPLEDGLPGTTALVHLADVLAHEALGTGAARFAPAILAAPGVKARLPRWRAMARGEVAAA